jgi:hypothetical protein
MTLTPLEAGTVLNAVTFFKIGATTLSIIAPSIIILRIMGLNCDTQHRHPACESHYADMPSVIIFGVAFAFLC